MQREREGHVLLIVFFSTFFAFTGLDTCTPSIGRPLTYISGYSALCMRSASVGILCLCEALAGVVTLATGAVSMAMSRFSAAASAACVLAKRWHRSVRMARRWAAALVHDIAADIGCEGWAGALSWWVGLGKLSEVRDRA